MRDQYFILSSHEMSGLYFVSGYVAKKEHIQSLTGDDEESHAEFTRLLSRGKLHHPPEWLFCLSQACYSAFKSLSKRDCVSHITSIFLEIAVAYCPQISTPPHTICRRFCNCFIKGEIRRYVDLVQVPPGQGPSARKIRKLEKS